MPKLRVEADWPGRAVIIADGQPQVGIDQFSIILEPSGQFFALSREAPGGFGTFVSCHKITKLTVTADYEEG
jgi:hypothetical protein